MNIADNIRQEGYRRINICGSPGSGKTTLARRLSSDLGIPYYDLDDILYNADCTPKPHEERSTAHLRLIEQSSFIIDGTYRSLFLQRLTRLDCIVIVTVPRHVSLYRFITRAIMTENVSCGERITLKTVSLILSFSSARAWIESQARIHNVPCLIESSYEPHHAR